MKSTGKIIAIFLVLAAGLVSCEKKEEEDTTTPRIEWTWVAGSETAGQAGTYGTLGVPDPANVPGAREDAAAWTGADGKFWLFGGYGEDSTSYPGRLNDLWAFDPASSNWTWMSGSALRDQAGLYGTRGVAHPANAPGARNGAASCVDAEGRLWLFGGLGYDAAGAIGQINDLWRFDPATVRWTWVSGGTDRYQPGVYGTLGAAGPANVPGARLGANLWTDADGRVWLFAGFGYDGAGDKGRLNDLWAFDPATGLWTWMSGSDAIEQPGTYGTKGTAAADNVPGARTTALAWAGTDGMFWIFGGNGRLTAESAGRLNDFWKYDPLTSEWTWVGGNALTNSPGTYGTMGTGSADNMPGARYGSTGWLDLGGQFWLFGGYGIDSSSAEGWLNDLWKYNPTTQDWTWVSGLGYHGQAGAYGTKGTASVSNIPGGRYLPVSWLDGQNRHWIFGGYGLDSTKTGGRLNDLWR